jgi:transposase-like protein
MWVLVQTSGGWVSLMTWRRPVRLNPLFHGRWFDDQIIVLCVRWCVSYKLSYRNLVEMMADRGLSVSHTTVMRWMVRYAPEFEPDIPSRICFKCSWR